MTDKADEFAKIWALLMPDAPKPKREYRFHPERKWRFDFAWPGFRVAVEVDGGCQMVRHDPRTGRPVVVGRHNQDADREKLNEAAVFGWRVLRFSPRQLSENPMGVVDQVHRALLLVQEKRDGARREIIEG